MVSDILEAAEELAFGRNSLYSVAANIKRQNCQLFFLKVGVVLCLNIIKEIINTRKRVFSIWINSCYLVVKKNSKYS